MESQVDMMLGAVGKEFKDVAITAGGLYLLGITVSLAHFSRFSILSLDLLRPQAVLIGAEVVAILGVVPLVCKWILSRVSRFRRLTRPLIPLTILLTFANIGVMAGLGLNLYSSAAVGLVITTMQLWTSRWSTGTASQTGSEGHKTSRAAPSLFIGAIVFALLVFPHIPAFIGGGRPLRVQVFPREGELLDHRFARTRNKPSINRTLDSYRLRLLYESEDEFYFLQDLRSKSGGEGHLVIRVPKDAIVRLDYYTPKWIHLGGLR